MNKQLINKIKCFVFGHRWMFIEQQKENTVCECILCGVRDTGEGVIVCPKCKKGILHGGFTSYICPLCKYKQKP